MGIHNRDYMKDRPLKFDGDPSDAPIRPMGRFRWKQIVLAVLLLAMIAIAVLTPS